MSPDITEPDVGKLLADLRSGQDYLRKTAAEMISENKLDDTQLVDQLKRLSASDPNKYVRQAATQALINLYEQPPVERKLPETLPERELSRDEKIRDFVIGFFGWYIVNGLIWLPLGNPTSSEVSVFAIFANLFIFPLNLLVLITLTVIKRTRKIALGILIALAVNLFLSLLVGMFVNGICFVPFFLEMPK